MSAMLATEALELKETPIPKGYELIEGRLVERKMGAKSILVAANLLHWLVAHCRATKVGLAFGSDMTYRCFQKKRSGRKPDVSFIRSERLAQDEVPDGDFFIPPDLAVEVVSPNDTFYDVIEKAEEFASAGVPLVWIIDPKNRLAIVRRNDGTLTLLHEGGQLDGESVIPGFRCLLSSCLLPTRGHEASGEGGQAES